MLFDNGKLIKSGTTFAVTTNFNAGTSVMGVNPFIVVRRDNTPTDILAKDRIEVHLPTLAKSNMTNRFVPTSKVDNSIFGQYSDKSEPKNNIYYVRIGNYPFALDINWDSSKDGDISKFMIPKETKSIDYSYPDFTKWVDSNGKTNTDWYLHLNTNM